MLRKRTLVIVSCDNNNRPIRTLTIPVHFPHKITTSCEVAEVVSVQLAHESLPSDKVYVELRNGCQRLWQGFTGLSRKDICGLFANWPLVFPTYSNLKGITMKTVYRVELWNTGTNNQHCGYGEADTKQGAIDAAIELAKYKAKYHGCRLIGYDEVTDKVLYYCPPSC